MFYEYTIFSENNLWNLFAAESQASVKSVRNMKVSNAVFMSVWLDTENDR
jgi:hypothetical protein